METIKTNDTKVDLAEANIPAPSVPGGDEPSGAPTGAPIAGAGPAPAEEPALPDPDEMQQAVIASEDRVARRDLIITIQGYYDSQRFGKFLQKTGLVEDLETLTIPQMQELLKDIRFSIQNRSSGDLIQRCVPGMLQVFEMYVSPFYDVKGVGMALQTSDTFKDLVEELRLENRILTNTPASTRILLEVGRACMTVHETNRIVRAATAEREVKVSSNTASLLS